MSTVALPRLVYDEPPPVEACASQEGHAGRIHITAQWAVRCGFWPVPITAWNDPKAGNSPGKKPIGNGWGNRRYEPRYWDQFRRSHPLGNLGLKLGSEGGVIDFDVDDPELAAPILARLFPDGVPPTLGWTNAEGRGHLLFQWDDRLAAYGKSIIKGWLHKKTGEVQGNPHYLGLELRLGEPPGAPKQIQTVIPPSLLSDGRTQRRWNDHPKILPAPESLFADLDAHAAETVNRASKTTVVPMNSEAKADKATTSSRDEAYAKGAFKSVVDEVAGTSEGGRNSTLNAGAFRLGRFVGAGLLGEDEVKSALQAAAEKAGLGATEARKTIASGLNAGKADPWDASERKDDDQGNGRATNGNGNRNIAATNGKGHTTNGKLVEESRPIDGDDLERRAIARLAESKFSGLLKDAPVLQELALLKGEQPARYATLRTSLREADRGFGIKVFEEAVRAHGPAKTPLDAFLEIGERAADEIDRPNESEDDPYRLARHYRDLRCTHRGKLKTRFHRGEILDWIPSKGAYRILPEKEVRASIGTVTKEEFDRINLEEITRWKIRGKRDANGEPCPKPVVRKVTEPLRTNVYGNLASLTVLPIADVPDQPAWLDPSYDWPPEEVLPTPTALIHVPSLVGGIDPATIPPTPDFFSTFALNYDFDPEAPEPVNWLTFLGAKPIGTDCEVKYQLWRGPDSDEVDWESIETLQEWMGLQLLPDSSHQKIMMLIGPKRSGKGTIARVLRRLVGEENVSGPTLSSLGGPFGTEPLIGKHTAIISDARISGRSDIAVIVERLLTTSGEDAVTVPRKHKPAWEGKLPTRLTILSNELPKITDSSGALAGRMILLPLTRSFYNVEDRGLTNRLMGEMPGILLWAIKGWERLRARGYFIQPESGKEQIDQLEDLVSPIGAYLKDRCDIGPGKRTPVKELHEDWKDWCQEKGRKEPGEESTFGRNLRAALPHLKTTQVRQGEGRIRVFEGIAIRNPKPDVDWSLPENSSRSAT